MCGGQRVWNAFIQNFYNVFACWTLEQNCHEEGWHELLISCHEVQHLNNLFTL